MRRTFLRTVVLAGLLSLTGCSDDLGERQAEALDGCKIGGCSSQYCMESGADWASSCEWLNEYACYRSATCERQTNGKCEWRATEELVTCLATH